MLLLFLFLLFCIGVAELYSRNSLLFKLENGKVLQHSQLQFFNFLSLYLFRFTY